MEQEHTTNRIAAWLYAHQEELIQTADYIFQHPELAYQETLSSEYLAQFLERHGFTGERGTAGIKTAFLASWQNTDSQAPVIGFLAEYDALPELGHACGHNLLGTGAAAAACALKSELAQSGNELAKACFFKFGQRIAEGLAPILSSFSPDCLCLGGQVTRSFQWFGQPLSALCQEKNIRLSITADTSERAIQGLCTL